MKRDPRLHGLTSEHHHALVLARLVRKAFAEDRVETSLRDDVLSRYDDELAPHFRTEEEVLLPALEEVGETALAARVREEHAHMRSLLERARSDVHHLEAFAIALHDHVRFEERELFGVCEEKLPSAVLDAVAARHPKPTRP